MALFLPDDREVLWDTSHLLELVKGYGVVFGTHSPYEAYLTALASMQLGTFKLLGAGCSEKEVENLIAAAELPVILLLADSISGDSGAALLARVRQLQPDLKAILLVNNLSNFGRDPGLARRFDGLVSAGNVGRGGIYRCLEAIIKQGRSYSDCGGLFSRMGHLQPRLSNCRCAGRPAHPPDLRLRPDRQHGTGGPNRYDYPAGDAQANQTVFGNFNQISELKQLHPNLRTNIVIGGWTLSGNFSTSLDSAAERSLFTDSVISFLKTYPMFDGVDFDWEYPGGGGLAGNGASPADGLDYTATLKLLREKLNSLGQESGRTYEISVASPAGIDKIPGMNLGDLAQSVDFFNLMAYDFHGTWESTTGHQAALTGDAIGYDISTAVNAYLAAGVDPGKIVLGSPMYSRAWKGVQSSPDDYGVADYGYKDASAGAALLVRPAPAPTPIPAPIPTPIPTPGTTDSSTSSPSGSSSDPIIGGGSGGSTPGFGGSTSGGITGIFPSGSGSGALTPADPLTNPMGAQVISVASGVTRLVASESLAETFKLSYAWGRQLTIEGFDSRHDRIDLRGFWGEATGAHAVASPAGALIELGFNVQQVLLAGVEASQLGTNGNLIV